MAHVPYKGGAQIITDLIGNQIDLAMLVTVSAVPHVKAGKMKGFGVTTAKRMPSAPGIPALAESPELKGFDMVAWTGLFAPAKTPPEIVARLNRELNDALASADVRGKFEEQGAVIGSGTPADFAAFLSKEQADFEKVVRAAGIKAE